MPWFEFECEICQTRFDQILTSASETDRVKCPHCKDGGKAKKLISGFKVAGRGDLRESSEFHGCHRPLESGGHVHGPGCNHGPSKPSGDSGSGSGSGTGSST